jgi:tetratricopeptide (TPR) repeat protein
MREAIFKAALVTAAVIWGALLPGGVEVRAQDSGNLTKLMIRSYDLLEAGKVDEAKKIYEQVLKRDPGNPLALNNLGAIMVKKGKYEAALSYLHQALPKAKGYKVMVNRVCEVNGICLAFRPLQEVYGNQQLEPLIKLNIQMIQGKLAEPAVK